MLGLIISIVVVGLIAGAVARLVVPGKQNMSIPVTILFGIVGSFLGGFLGFLLFRSNAGSGRRRRWWWSGRRRARRAERARSLESGATARRSDGAKTLGRASRVFLHQSG
jgi:uncharacterized membrane protein YeaQ/YmgE (transglycosylase-associated protein family)